MKESEACMTCFTLLDSTSIDCSILLLHSTAPLCCSTEKNEAAWKSGEEQETGAGKWSRMGAEWGQNEAVLQCVAPLCCSMEKNG
jgi:hypothetical protein